MRLKFWLYYYHYNRITVNNNYFSLGVQLNVPFPFSVESRRQNVLSESRLFQVKLEREVHARTLEALNS